MKKESNPPPPSGAKPTPPPAPPSKIRIGQHWLEVALERINAGEPEQDVMLDYGYLNVSNRGNEHE